MAQTVRDVMTADPIKLPASERITTAAKAMRDSDVGDVLVTDDDQHLVGIVTDRDIVVRAVADGSADTATLDAVCSEPVWLAPDRPVEEAIDLMRERAIRRLPVVDQDVVIGIVSLGDLAVERDPKSALGEISAARPTT